MFAIMRHSVIFIGFHLLCILGEELLQPPSKPTSEENLKAQDESPVVVLTNSNFSDFVQNTQIALVEFYAPWCGHCKRLAPEYDLAAKELKKSTNVVLAKVDATAETDLGHKYAASGYPSLWWFLNGEANEYDGDRNAFGPNGMIEYMKERAKPGWKKPSLASIVLTAENFTKYTERKDNYLLVLFYNSSSPSCSPGDMCSSMRREFELAASEYKRRQEHENDDLGVEVVFAQYDISLIPLLKEEYQQSESLFLEKLGVTQERLREALETSHSYILTIRRGKANKFDGHTDKWSLYNYVMQNAPDSSRVPKSFNQWFAAGQDGERARIFAFMKSEDDEIFKAYMDLANSMRKENYPFAHVFLGEEAKPYLEHFAKLAREAPPNLKTPSLPEEPMMLIEMSPRFRSKYDPPFHLFSNAAPGSWQQIPLRRWIQQKSLPLIGEYNHDTINSLYRAPDAGIPRLCIFFYTVDWSKEHRKATQEWRVKFEKVAIKYREPPNRIVFAIADDQAQNTAMQGLVLDQSEEDINLGCWHWPMPPNMSDPDTKSTPWAGEIKYRLWPPMENYDYDEVIEFLDKFVTGKLKPVYKSAMKPARERSRLRTWVSDTWESEMSSAVAGEKSVFLMVYSPFCRSGECTETELAFKQLAARYDSARVDWVVFAKLDLVENDLPDYRFQAPDSDQRPSIYLLPFDAKSPFNFAAPIKFAPSEDVKMSMAELAVFLYKHLPRAPIPQGHTTPVGVPEMDENIKTEL